MTLNEFIARATSFFDKAEATIPTTAADLAKAQSDLAASNAENITLKEQAGESAKRITELEAALAAKDSEIVALKAASEKAAKETADTIAAQGIPADQLPDNGKAASTITDQFLAITDPKEKTIFFRKHEAEIKAARK